MRTKALLLGAAVGAISLATSMAQVYSVNIVGYINMVIQPGFQMVANQLNNPAGNTIANLFPNPPGGMTVYKFNGSGYDLYIYDVDAGGWNTEAMTTTLAPGEGAFIGYVADGPYTNTLVGDVMLTSSVNLPMGFSVFSSVIPQELPLDQLGFPADTLGAFTVYRFNGSGYDLCIYDVDAGGWPAGGAPALRVGESVFLGVTGSAASWARTFSVGP